MPEAVAPIEIGNALLLVKRSIRSIKSLSGMVKSKLAGIETVLTVINEKADDVASEPPTTDIVIALLDIKTKLDVQTRFLRDTVAKTETVSDALDVIVG
jgi:hypothetical protein